MVAGDGAAVAEGHAHPVAGNEEPRAEGIDAAVHGTDAFIEHDAARGPAVVRIAGSTAAMDRAVPGREHRHLRAIGALVVWRVQHRPRRVDHGPRAPDVPRRRSYLRDRRRPQLPRGSPPRRSCTSPNSDGCAPPVCPQRPGPARRGRSDRPRRSRAAGSPPAPAPPRRWCERFPATYRCT